MKQFGGKGEQLIALQKAGFPTPDFVCLDAARLFRLFFAQSPTVFAFIQSGLKRISTLELLDTNWCDSVYEKLMEVPFDLQEWEDILASLQPLFDNNLYVSVRSSAIGEDSVSHSFAGQHHTELYVEKAILEQAIRKAMASVWTHSALSYRLIHKLPMPLEGMALVVQKMVHAYKAGVGFSMHTGGNLADAVLSVAYGLGEGIVSGLSDTDTYLKSRTSGMVRIQTRFKKNYLDWSKEKGVHEEKVSTDKAKESCLTLKEAASVFEYLEKAEKLIGNPADVEFVFDPKGCLWILQIRPITTIKREELEILDNTNIAESYPGLSLPLTYSFAANAYERLFKESAATFSLSSNEKERLKSVFPHLIAHYNGRIYYRLDNWYRMTALVYQSKKSLKAWEKAVGLPDSAADSYHFSWIGKLRMTLTVASLILFFKRNNHKFFAAFEVNYAFFKKLNHAKGLSFETLWNHMKVAMDQTFRPWPQTVVNDFLAFHLYGWLIRIIKKWKISDEEEFANELISGYGKVESEQAVVAMLSIKEMIVQSSALTTLFQQDDDIILQTIAEQTYPGFSDAWNQYLLWYGDRCLEELKLETIPPSLQPNLLIGLLRSQLQSPLNAEGFEKGREAVKKKAWNKVKEKLGFPRRILFTLLANGAAYAVMNRENMRFCRTRIFAASRYLFLAMGEELRSKGIIHHARDVFYLELKDFERLIKQQVNGAELRKEIEDKKALFATYTNMTLPDRVIYPKGKIPLLLTEDSSEWLQNSDSNKFVGIPVSGGWVEAEAIVIFEPNLNIEVRNKILVSRITDPGWVFLMSQAAGLVTEKGSLLSHTAIVGRELGIPVIVGVEGITHFIKTGDKIKVDGSRGVVEKC